MKRSGLRPTKKHRECNGAGCSVCDQRGWMIKPPKPRTKIKPIKNGRSNLNKQYLVARREFLTSHPRCQVLQPHGGPCGAEATECHHRRGRGRYYLDQATFLACCQSCHSLLHGKLAAFGHAMGYLISVASTKPTAPPSDVFIPYDQCSKHQA